MTRLVSAEEAAFHAGVEAMRAQVIAYLTNPQSGVGISKYAVSAITTEVLAMHPGDVNARVATMLEAADRAATRK